MSGTENDVNRDGAQARAAFGTAVERLGDLMGDMLKLMNRVELTGNEDLKEWCEEVAEVMSGCKSYQGLKDHYETKMNNATVELQELYIDVMKRRMENSLMEEGTVQDIDDLAITLQAEEASEKLVQKQSDAESQTLSVTKQFAEAQRKLEPLVEAGTKLLKRVRFA